MSRPGALPAAAAALAGALACAPAAAATPADGYSAVLTYLDTPAPRGPLINPPHLSLSVAQGRVLRAVMDTGSTGVVVAADAIPGAARLPGEPGSLAYSSSGRIMLGRWVQVPVAISGGNGATVRTAPIPVLAVDRVACMERARNCTPGPPHGLAMIGIGFGREADHQLRATPDHNPFLNLDRPAWHGWIVQRDAVRVGLTAQAVRGFATVALSRSAIWPDWEQATGCVTVGPGAAPACGAALVDTGVERMFLALPRQRLPALGRHHSGSRNGGGGRLPDADHAVARYRFSAARPETRLRPAALSWWRATCLS